MTTVQQLLEFLNTSPTAFHAVSNMKEALLKQGAMELYESKAWALVPGGSYFTTRNDSSLIAFRIPETAPVGFMIGASHSDSPALKIKPHPELTSEGIVRLNVEVNGGMICAPWFDRPLSIAGRVCVKTPEGITSKLINIDRDLLVIPNLAIHMDRSVNEGHPIKVQKEMLPVLRTADSEGSFESLISEAAGVNEEDILSHDLYLYPRVKATTYGMHEEFIGAQRLDDLQCGFADLQGYLSAAPSASIPVFAIFNHEEVGSSTAAGAAGTFLEDTLKRIQECLGISENGFRAMLANSFLVSADNAHAVHPNYAEKADPGCHPHMNQGIVLKYAARQTYTTDAISAAVFKTICERVNVPVQEFTNHSDIKGGSTLGKLSQEHISVPTADIGLAQLAMHSCYETAGVKDTDYLITAMTRFFASSLETGEHGELRIR